MKIFKKIIRNKQAAGWSWIYGLAFLFALGLLYTVFLYVFEGHLVPTIKTTANSTLTDPTAIASINDGIDKYMVYFKIMPFVLFFVVVVYMIATTIYRGSTGQYQ